MRILQDRDYTLGDVIAIFSQGDDKTKISPQSIDLTVSLGEGATLTVPSLTSIMLATSEKVELATNQCAFYTLRSTMARRGWMLSHPGWIDGGYSGNITFRIFNSTNHQLVIENDERIIQLIVFDLDENPESGYNGAYQNSSGVVGDKYNE